MTFVISANYHTAGCVPQRIKSTGHRLFVINSLWPVVQLMYFKLLKHLYGLVYHFIVAVGNLIVAIHAPYLLGKKGFQA